MTAPWPDHLLSLTEWDELGEDNSHHYELADGVLRVSPRPPPRHQFAGVVLATLLNEQLPDRWAAFTDIEITTIDGKPPTVRVPDVAVAPSSLLTDERVRVSARELALAVEVISLGSRGVDRLNKLAEYTDAGIPRYWLVDLDGPVRLIEYELAGDIYRVRTQHSRGLFTTDVPAPLRIDLDALTRRR